MRLSLKNILYTNSNNNIWFYLRIELKVEAELMIKRFDEQWGSVEMFAGLKKKTSVSVEKNNHRSNFRCNETSNNEHKNSKRRTHTTLKRVLQ